MLVLAKPYTEILGLSEMSDKKWNCAEWLSGDLLMLKVIMMIVPFFILTLLASEKKKHLCKWGFVESCSYNSTFDQYVRPHFFFHAFSL